MASQHPFGGDVSYRLPLRSSGGLFGPGLRTAAAAPVGLWDALKGRSKRSAKSIGDGTPGGLKLAVVGTLRSPAENHLPEAIVFREVLRNEYATPEPRAEFATLGYTGPVGQPPTPLQNGPHLASVDGLERYCILRRDLVVSHNEVVVEAKFVSKLARGPRKSRCPYCIEDDCPQYRFRARSRPEAVE